MRLYRSGDFPPVELVTTNLKGESFVERFDPKEDIPATTYVEVDLPYSVPMDKNQLIVAARQAINAPQILSRETLWETISELGVEDKELEYERILRDQMAELPAIKLIYTVEYLREEAEKWEKRGNADIAEKLRGYADLLEQQIPSAAGTPTARTPSPEGGVAGGVIPPERMGRSRAEESMQRGEVPPGVGEAALRRVAGA
jgi:hypothetical protein